jgi:hypothetical protein
VQAGGLFDGAYDDLYDIFLEDRAKAILAAIDQHLYSPLAEVIDHLKHSS